MATTPPSPVSVLYLCPGVGTVSITGRALQKVTKLWVVPPGLMEGDIHLAKVQWEGIYGQRPRTMGGEEVAGSVILVLLFH